MTIWTEIRPTLKRIGPPVFVPIDRVYEYQGFRSIFGIKDLAAAKCKQEGSTAGLTDDDLYCDTLFLDFDNDTTAEDKARDALLDKKVKFSEYTTGGRGRHFHVPIRVLTSGSITSDVKGFVRDNFPGADLSIYKTSGIIRLPGTYHEKYPGRKKELIKTVRGGLLEIKQNDELYPMPKVVREVEENSTEALFSALFRPIKEGGRNTKIFILGCLAKESGLPFDEALNMALKYNMTQVWPPLPDNEILATIRSSFNGLRK
jgi:hypothetical protein